MKRLTHLSFVCLLAVFLVSAGHGKAAMVGEATRIGTLEYTTDYPTKATTKKLYDEMDFQRAVQAYLWATPIVALNEVYVGNKKAFNAGFGDQMLFTRYATPTDVGLTVNSTTIYTFSTIDLSKDGPVVIESPAGAYGMIDDYWQRPISEIGPVGPDKGKGGKFLIVPPGYAGEKPDGYFFVQSTTNKVFYMVRGLVHNGKVQAAVDSLRQIMIYPYNKKDNPPKQKVIDINRPSDTIAPRGFEYWERLSTIINSEPVQERDRFFMAMLKPLGLEKGKPFSPDERQKRILTEAAAVGFRMAQAISLEPRIPDLILYPGTHWEHVMTVNPNQETEYYSQLDERVDYFFEAITLSEGMVKPFVGAGSQYASAARDKDGDWLDGSRTYRLNVPANVPVKEFWSVTAYDNMTRSMVVTDTNKAALSSMDGDSLQKNADGSIDIYFGPEAPAGKESNWIKTAGGKGWFAYFRWYSPTQVFFDKTWKLGDIEKVAR